MPLVPLVPIPPTASPATADTTGPSPMEDYAQLVPQDALRVIRQGYAPVAYPATTSSKVTVWLVRPTARPVAMVRPAPHARREY